MKEERADQNEAEARRVKVVIVRKRKEIAIQGDRVGLSAGRCTEWGLARTVDCGEMWNAVPLCAGCMLYVSRVSQGYRALGLKLGGRRRYGIAVVCWIQAAVRAEQARALAKELKEWR